MTCATYAEFLADPRNARVEALTALDESMTPEQRGEYAELGFFIIGRSAAFARENPAKALANAQALLAMLEG